MWAYTCHNVTSEDSLLHSFLPPCGAWGSNSGSWAQSQMPLPIEPSCRPCIPTFKMMQIHAYQPGNISVIYNDP